LTITVEDGRVTDLRGDPLDPLSRGAICPKGTALLDLYADPDRLRTPIRRDGAAWAPIEWDAAFDLAVDRLREIARVHGNDAIAVYLGNPTAHNSGTLLSMGGFLNALQTKNRYSATSVDQLPSHVAALEMFGHPALIPVPDVDRTDYFLIMGANPLVSNGSLMTAPGMRTRLREIRERGGRVVVLDPRRTETAAVADEHVFVRPGSDAALLLALLDTIFSEDLVRLGRLEPVFRKLDVLREAARAFPAERVAAFTGVAADTIRRIAREFAAARRPVAYGRIGLSTQAFGGLCQWLVLALNAVCGRLDAEGGMMWPQPAFDLILGAKAGEAHSGRWHSRVRGLPEIYNELPVAALIEEMQTPGEGQIRALVTVAGNPVLSTPNGGLLDRVLPGLDFMLCIDPYVNETTRHADLILPPAHGLETEHYDVIFHQFAVRNTARYSEPVFAIDESQRFDWQIFGALRERLTGKRGATPRERLDTGLRYGAYRTSLEAVRAHEHGVDFGPLAPCMPERLLTGDARIDLAPATFVADLKRLDAALAEPVPELALIGRRQLRGNNSWMHNAPRLMRGPDRCTLQIGIADAAARGISSGDVVEVASDAGEIAVLAEVTPDLMPGVVSLPHGFGHGNAAVLLSVAHDRPGASYNDLTDSTRIDELTGNAALCGVPVSVRLRREAEVAAVS
jgi:anaerobic selenocysteine-containing dehydrogenase